MTRKRNCRVSTTKPRICSPLRGGKLPLDSYARIVSHYEANYREPAAAELQFFAEQPDLPAVVKLATFAKTSGEHRHPHHRRRSMSTLRHAYRRMARCQFEACSTFHELHAMLADAIRDIKWIGDLFIYDAALAIGAHLNLEPKKVYLHSGTRVGARAMGLGRGKNTLDQKDLPRPFWRLHAYEIEDCLCIYKDEIKSINYSR